jgi:uncharacterized repeat protein (TIGR01451 family)
VTGLVNASSSDTITFKLYDNPNGTGTPLFTDTETVSISGSTATATSAGYTATAAGTDYWVATFNGDANNAKVSSGTADEPVTITGGAPDIAVTKTADQGTVTAGSTIGFSVTITNTGGANATGVTLQDNLPPGGGGDVFWSIDTSNTGLGAGTNPSSFNISGPKGNQVLTLAGQPITLAAGASLKVHITSPTNTADVSGGAVGVQSGVNPISYLGSAGDYGVLYILGSGTHTLQITNVTIGANIGVGSSVGGSGTPKVSFGGPGTITGRLDFQGANTGQFSNNNGSNVGPASVNYNVAQVTSAISTVTSLSSSLAGLGNNIAINGTQTINESAGQLDTVNGVTYRVFNVTSYNSGDGKLLTINGDGSGDPVVFDFGSNFGNVNLGGDVALTGNGLSDDKVIWNFTSSGKNIGLNNNASSYPSVAFHGIILAPNDAISLVNANLSGRVFGGGTQDMQIVSGVTLHAPVLNTATVTASNVTFDSDDSASDTVTITGSFKPSQHLVTSDSGIATNAFGVIGNGDAMQQGTLLVYVDNSAGLITADELARIDDAISVYNAELNSAGLTLVEVGSDQAASANITISMADTTDIGGASDGVLGVTMPGGTILLVNGWNWYTGSDASGIGSNQYDFETVAMHELGHGIGLGHSTDTSSVMYPSLANGDVRRDLSTADLSLIESDSGPEPLLAAGWSAPGVRDTIVQPAQEQTPATLPAVIAAPAHTATPTVAARSSSLDPTVLSTSFTTLLPRELGALTITVRHPSAVATGLMTDSSVKAEGAMMAAAQASPLVVHNQILPPVRQERGFDADSTLAGSSLAAPALPPASVSTDTAAPTYLDKSSTLPAKTELPANSSLPCDDYFATCLDEPVLSESGSFGLSDCEETAGGTTVFAAALGALLYGQRAERSDPASEGKRVSLRS